METCKLDDKKSTCALEKNFMKRKIEEKWVEKREHKRVVFIKIETTKDPLNRKFGIDEKEIFDFF